MDGVVVWSEEAVLRFPSSDLRDSIGYKVPHQSANCIAPAVFMYLGSNSNWWVGGWRDEMR